MRKPIITICLCLAIIFSPALFGEWASLTAGMDLGNFSANKDKNGPTAPIIILRIDPKLFEFELVAKSEESEQKNKTAKQWSKKHKFVAAINAGMFAQDYSKHIGYMRDDKHVNNAHVNKYQSVAAFSPKHEGIPPFQIFDLDQPKVSMNMITQDYSAVVQNLRLIKKPGENRWSQQNKKWSEAALGQDKDGNVLFIFTRTPFSMHDLNNRLLALDIDLVAAQHLEGGPEAQLYINVNDKEFEMFGSYETAFNENDTNSLSWPVPNVIGVKAK